MMTSLHIFTGAPVKVDDDCLGKCSQNIWKSFKFSKSQFDQLLDFRSFSEEELSEVFLDYEVNCSQLSDVPKLFSKQIAAEVPKHINTQNIILSTPTDKLYQEINVQSQFLLEKTKKRSDFFPSGYHDFSQESSTICHFSSVNRPNIVKSKNVDSVIKVIEETDMKNCDKSQKKNTNRRRKTSSIYASDWSLKMHRVALTSISSAVKSTWSSNLLVVVLQVNPAKRIQIKKGTNTGRFASLSSVVVGDRSQFYFSITLWNDCADWTERLRAGDVILITNISVQFYRGKHVGQSNTISRVYNFHCPILPYPDEWSTIVGFEKLTEFTSWLQSTHPYILSTSFHSSEEICKNFAALSCQHLNDIHAKIISCNIFDGNGNCYSYMSKMLPKAMLDVVDSNDEVLQVFIWGEQYKWLQNFQLLVNSIIVMKQLLCRYDDRRKCHVLHTTHKSSYSLDFEEQYQQCCKDTMCSVKSIFVRGIQDTGVYITKENMLDVKNVQSLLYTGCSECHVRLTKDDNGVHNTNCKCSKADAKICFNKFQLALKKRRNESALISNGGISINKQNKNSCLIADIETDEIARKVFPKFSPSSASESDEGTVASLLHEIENLLTHKSFQVRMNKIEIEDEFSMMKEKKYVLEDIQYL